MEELPMIIFTIVAQMSVGAFWALGAIHVAGYLKKISPEAVDRITNAALFAVGPLLVAGFIAAFFHLNDPFNSIHTLSHFGSSWLSRELVFGVAFAGSGALFAITQWFGLLSRGLREVLAVLTAAAGFGLVLSMAGVYFSVETIPAWNTWHIPVFFFASALLTGSLAVAVALLVIWNHSHAGKKGVLAKVSNRGSDDTAPLGDDLIALIRTSVQWLSITAASAGVVIMLTYPMYFQYLAHNANPAAQDVSARLDGAFLAWRLILLGVAVVIAGGFAFARARVTETPSGKLSFLLVTALLLAVISEVLGRNMHYEGLWHVGLNTWQMYGGH
ncbi:MAG: dimethyl sulfoxide reductase anchor subunit [Actinomycetaceae bacterium]|nr:dimethyl sulfoxide reductase anchor subunit [Actinomycetaceae bacterium]